MPWGSQSWSNSPRYPAAIAAAVIVNIVAHSSNAQIGPKPSDVMLEAMVTDVRDGKFALPVLSQDNDSVGILPYSIMVTGDGQMGPDIELRTPNKAPDVVDGE